MKATYESIKNVLALLRNNMNYYRKKGKINLGRPCRKDTFPCFNLTNIQINNPTESRTKNYLTSHHNSIIQGKTLSVTCPVRL